MVKNVLDYGGEFKSPHLLIIHVPFIFQMLLLFRHKFGLINVPILEKSEI